MGILWLRHIPGIHVNAVVVKGNIIRIFSDEFQKSPDYKVWFQVLLAPGGQEQIDSVFFKLHLIDHRFDVCLCFASLSLFQDHYTFLPQEFVCFPAP